MIKEHRQRPTHAFLRPKLAVFRTVSTLLFALRIAACAEPSESDESLKPSQVEQRADALEGEFRVYVVDYQDGSHRQGYALKLATGEHVELAFAEPPELRPGARVSLAGSFASQRPAFRDSQGLGARRFAVSQVLANETSHLGRADQALVTPPSSEHTGAVVLLNFSGQAPQNYSLDTLKQELKVVEEYYKEISYGSWILHLDAFGPFELPTPNDCDLTAMVDRGKQAARDHGVDIDKYEHVGIKIGGNQGYECPCGLAWVGQTPAQGNPHNGGSSLYTCGGPNAYAHEMGHGFGLNHASTALCKGERYRRGLEGCDIDEYGDHFNTMGNGLGHFSAYQKATMGWTAACNNVRVRSDAEFDLEPMQVATDNPQGLQIDTGDTRAGGPLYYYVEYRNPDLAKFNATDDNSTHPREKGPGLHLNVARDYRENNGESKPILIDVSAGLTGFDGNGDPRLKAGEKYEDPDGRVTIELVQMSPQRARVKVSFPGGGSGANQCQNGQTPPPLDGDPGDDDPFPEGPAASLYQHCNYGGWAVALAEGEYTQADLVAMGAFDNDASSIEVADGYEVTVFDEDNFAGESVTLTAALACFVDKNFNDRMSSLRVRSLKPVDPGDGDQGGDGDQMSGDGDDQPGDGDGDGATGDGDEGPLPGEGDGDEGDGDGDGDSNANGDGDGDSDDDPTTPPLAGACSLAPSRHGTGLMTLLGWASALTVLSRRRRRT